MSHTNTKAGAFTSAKDKRKVWNIAINTTVGGTYAGDPDTRPGWLPAKDGARSQGWWCHNNIPAAPAPNGVADIRLEPWNRIPGATSDYYIDYFRRNEKA